jgi:hypothetical protein
VSAGKENWTSAQFSMSLDNILLSNLKTSFSGTFHVFDFNNYSKCYLSGFCFCFCRRFKMSEMTERIANATCFCKPCPERALNVAEPYA